MKLLDLKGYNSYRALNAFHVLMLGLKMLPMYMGETYEEFYGRIEKMSLEEQKKFIQEAALFVKLDPEEIDALTCFCADDNGVPYTKVNVKSLGPDEIMKIIVAVCVEISKFKVDFVTDSEKKN